MSKPQSANEVLEQVLDDHAWTPAEMSTNTTPGLQRTIEYHTHALKALANYIDGRLNASGAPVEHAVEPSPPLIEPLSERV